MNGFEVCSFMFSNSTLARVKRVSREQGLSSAVSHYDYCFGDLQEVFLTPGFLQGKRGSLWVAFLGSNYGAGCP